MVPVTVKNSCSTCEVVLRKLSISWWLLYPGILAWLVRMVYERSLLTWTRGPQMGGFTFYHQHPFFFLISAISILLCRLWLILAALVLISSWTKDMKHQWVRISAVTIVSMAPLVIPSYYSAITVFILLGALFVVTLYRRDDVPTLAIFQITLMILAMALETIPTFAWQSLLKSLLGTSPR
jgi:hypothetical protein